MAFENQLFYSYTAISGLIGLIGILIGYWKINRSIQGVVIGYIIFKIFSVIATPYILGTIIKGGG